MTRLRPIAIAVVFLTLAACGDGGGSGNDSAVRIPSEAELAGTYDLATTFAGSSQPALGVASASVGFDLTLSVPPVTMHGTLDKNGTVALEGTNFGSDAREFVHGRARVEVRAGVLRILGALDDPPFEATFVMERPVGSDLTGTSGPYLLRLDRSPSSCGCSTVVHLDLTVAAGGTGSAPDASELFPDEGGGLVVGALTGVSVLITPTGRFTMSARYDNPPLEFCAPTTFGGPCTFSSSGTLPAHPGASTSADFVVRDGLTVEVGAGTIAIVR